MLTAGTWELRGIFTQLPSETVKLANGLDCEGHASQKKIVLGAFAALLILAVIATGLILTPKPDSLGTHDLNAPD